MPWGSIEFEPEVEKWFLGLTEEEQGQVQFYLDLLEEKGVLLDEPYTRQLRGKLRELRFYLGRERRRITYFIATGRRIPMLTVFRKTQRREQREIDRAKAAMETWLARETKGKGRT